MPLHQRIPVNRYKVRRYAANKDETEHTIGDTKSLERELPESVLAKYYNHDVLTRRQERALNREIRNSLNAYRHEMLSSGFVASSIVSILTEKSAQKAVGLDSSWLVEAVFPAWRSVYRKKEAIVAHVQKTRALLSTGDYANPRLIRAWEADCAWYRRMLASLKPTARLLDFCLEGYGDVRGLQHYRDLLIVTPAGNKSARRELAKTVALETLILPKQLPVLIQLAEAARAAFVEKRDFFLMSNLKFTKIVVSELKDYLPFTFSNTIDLESVGNQGAQKAIERFKAGRAKYTTYARWWIYQSALREIQRTRRGMRLPLGLQEKLHALRRTIAGLQEEEGENYEPSAEELAEYTDIPKKIIASFLQNDYDAISLQTPFGDDGNEIGTTIEDTAQRPAYEGAHRNGCKTSIDELLAELHPREQTVLRGRFGLSGESRPKTLEEIGREQRVTRERIRQIEKKALRKLRLRLERKEYEFTGEKGSLSREDIG